MPVTTLIERLAVESQRIVHPDVDAVPIGAVGRIDQMNVRRIIPRRVGARIIVLLRFEQLDDVGLVRTLETERDLIGLTIHCNLHGL